MLKGVKKATHLLYCKIIYKINNHFNKEYPFRHLDYFVISFYYTLLLLV